MTRKRFYLWWQTIQGVGLRGLLVQSGPSDGGRRSHGHRTPVVKGAEECSRRPHREPCQARQEPVADDGGLLHDREGK
jgi:hypothetical protein